jgi:hypothetical protein
MSMDAREVIRHFLQGTDLSCDDLITALEWHGNRIVHHDENHGPTLERAAEVADARAMRIKEIGDAPHAVATANSIAAAIRQLKEGRP